MTIFARPHYFFSQKSSGVLLESAKLNDIGICIDTMRSWLKASGVQMGEASRQNREQQRIRELEAEVRGLRKQLVEKEEGIDILKKSVGILSKP